MARAARGRGLGDCPDPPPYSRRHFPVIDETRDPINRSLPTTRGRSSDSRE